MSKRNDEVADSDDAIWKDATILSPAETKDVKIHLSLRLDASLYRAVLSEKKSKRDRTVTATIERLLRDGLKGQSHRANAEVLQAVRNMIAHGVAQDAILVLIARNMKLNSAEEKRLFETFHAYFARLEPFKDWLSAEPSGSEATVQPSAREELIKAVFDPTSLGNAS
jgi:hypothetical protein